MRDFSSVKRWRWPGALAVLAGVALAVAGAIHFRGSSARLLLAPMIGLDTCLSPASTPTTGGAGDAELVKSCSGPQGSAASLVESTLAALQPAGSKSPSYELGYTLNVPLLQLFKEREGDWVIDKEFLGRLVRTIRDTNRPLILYLFSTHFGQNAPIEAALAADPTNLSWTRDGPLPKDTYYASPIYDWSLNRRTAIETRRVQAAQAVLREICRLDPADIRKVRAITLLGEVHQLFPHFETGMGFMSPYLITDYSEASKTAFREALQRYIGTIEQLNANIGTRFASFDQVEPPSKDVRTTPLRDFTEHIDSFAHGWLPISGWAYVPGATDTSPAMVRIYRNGDLIARVPATLGRQDVLAALPELGTANTGWRYDMDFRKLPVGSYRIDVLLENKPNDLVHLASRTIIISDRTQQAARPMPQRGLPASRPADKSTKASVDLPVDQSSYFYNPLVTYWHAFRALQVVEYLQSFNKSLDAPCMAQTARYTHQIVPFTNPGWDENKFAIGASLRQLDRIETGVSLYGEPTYGASFFNWLVDSPHKQYGVTEFHPLKPLDARELQRVLAAHESHGAQFISFFLEPRWNGRRVLRAHNLFSLDPDNPKFGSPQLYESVRQVLGSDAVKAAPVRSTP
jgi:hypothetical protein